MDHDVGCRLRVSAAFRFALADWMKGLDVKVALWNGALECESLLVENRRMHYQHWHGAARNDVLDVLRRIQPEWATKALLEAYAAPTEKRELVLLRAENAALRAGWETKVIGDRTFDVGDLLARAAWTADGVAAGLFDEEEGAE